MIMAQTAIILFASAIAGTFLHWLKKVWRDDMPGNPINYLIVHPWNTAAMFGVTFAACAAILATDQLASASVAMIIGVGFTAGWTADSAINKGPGQ